MNKSTILEVNGLKKYFPIQRGIFRSVVGYNRAVDGVDLSITQGETLGLVGESGCGKTTLGRCVLQLLKSTQGEIFYSFADGSRRNLLQLDKRRLKEAKKEIQVVFQDPYSSLNPSTTIFKTLEEPMKIHGFKNIKERIGGLLESVNLNPGYMYRYPHEFSGGQRQRIGIARALSVEPRLIIYDEPVSALDVSIQAQVLELLKKLQNEFGLTYLFIAHDISVIEYISDEVAVMYLGRIVERALSEKLYHERRHPYSEALFSAVPIPNPLNKRNRIILEGDVPDPANPPCGCHFHPRCRYSKEVCTRETPRLLPLSNRPDHLVACHMVHN